MSQRLVRLAVSLFLGLQIVWLVTRPLHGNFYWAWAPFHELAWYRIEVTDGDQHLDQSQAMERYHLRTWFTDGEGRAWQSNAMWWVFRAIDQTEQARASPTRTTVVVTYAVNGRAAPQTWTASYERQSGR